MGRSLGSFVKPLSNLRWTCLPCVPTTVTVWVTCTTFFWGGGGEPKTREESISTTITHCLVRSIISQIWLRICQHPCFRTPSWSQPSDILPGHAATYSSAAAYQTWTKASWWYHTVKTGSDLWNRWCSERMLDSSKLTMQEINITWNRLDVL